MPVLRLDHVVIHVTDWERSNAFYRDVVGVEVVKSGAGHAYKVGDQMLKCHGPGLEPEPLARVPVAPGNSDLCFVWDGDVDDAIDHLHAHGVEIEEGPVSRTGAFGPGKSVYFRDPDGSLLEFMSYA
jgi:catechol 2,3-dioxygenase-like lactoylglutathione lyase family enzyme